MNWIIDNWECIPAGMRGKKLHLLTIKELDQKPNGTKLVSIMGRSVIKGKHHISRDHRGGWSAYGLLLK